MPISETAVSVNKHILIIDDNQSICEVIKMMLEMYGYIITTQITGKDIVPFIINLKPDLVLLDIMLDNYDGRQICEEIKQQEAAKHIPIVLMSAKHNLNDILKANDRSNDFIHKPFELINLIKIVEQNLARPL